MLASRFRTKESPSNQNLPYIILKTRFPFIYASTSLATNRNFESCLLILFLAPQRAPRFFHFCRRIFPLATLPTIVSSSSKLHSAIEIKKNVSAMDYFSREILILHHRCQEVLLSHWFAVSGGKVISWRGASCLQILMSLNFAFDYGRNKTTLSEFIGTVNQTDFRQISPKHFRNNNKQKYVGKF